MTAVLALGAIAIVGWFWFDTMKIRELANAAARHNCRKAALQFLDGTVAFAKLSVVTTSAGLKFRRVFVFDYSEDGENRKQGFLIFVGGHISGIGFESVQRH
ncbi:MAG: DUF3301 domain-containing protein [Gammaproteobacteria bacterium]|nr:DUF3301 domain-containing protein [Gammaproteobacteria bacterium]